MTGGNEVPPVNVLTSGYTSLRTASNDTVIKYKINITGLSDATGAHIHQGKVGQNGEIVVDLLNNSKKNEIKVGMAIRGNITNSTLLGPMKGKPLDILLSEMESGNTYVNIITSNHPNGEMRGQIQPGGGQSLNQNSSPSTNTTKMVNTTSS
jgi:hypothetical protein